MNLRLSWNVTFLKLLRFLSVINSLLSALFLFLLLLVLLVLDFDLRRISSLSGFLFPFLVGLVALRWR